MQFDVEYTSHAKIKTTSFETSDKTMWRLKEDFRGEGKFSPDPEPRIIDPTPNLMAADTNSGGSSMFDLRARHHALHSRVAEDDGDASHGPQLRQKPFRPAFKRPLVKHWKETIGSAHSSR